MKSSYLFGCREHVFFESRTSRDETTVAIPINRNLFSHIHISQQTKAISFFPTPIKFCSHSFPSLAVSMVEFWTLYLFYLSYLIADLDLAGKFFNSLRLSVFNNTESTAGRLFCPSLHWTWAKTVANTIHPIWSPSFSMRLSLQNLQLPTI